MWTRLASVVCMLNSVLGFGWILRAARRSSPSYLSMQFSEAVSERIEFNKQQRESLKKSAYFQERNWTNHLGVDVLRESPLVGVIDVPRMEKPFLSSGPKGFDLVSHDTKLLITEQRVSFARDLINVLESGGTSLSSGKLLSGPNGVGKSGIGLFAALCCQARSLPVLYLPSAFNWMQAVDAGTYTAGQWFMHWFFVQNADLISKDDKLKQHFLDQLAGNLNVTDVKKESYALFTDALLNNMIPPCAFITDEVQCLYEHSANHKQSQFRNDFVIWTGPSGHLSSLLIASANGLADLCLPSGEEPRLRYIEPLTKADTELLLTDCKSPLYLNDVFASMAPEVFKITGGVTRSLFDLRDSLDKGDNTTILKTRLRIFEVKKQLSFENILHVWLDRKVEAQDRLLAVESLLKMVCGTQELDPYSKSVYDQGLVQCDHNSNRVRPVSELAKRTMLSVYNKRFGSVVQPVSSYRDAPARGFAFQQMITVGIAMRGSQVSLVGHKYSDIEVTKPIRISCEENKYFTAMEEIVFDTEKAVQWISTDPQHNSDGLLIRPQLESDGSVMVARDGRAVFEVLMLDPSVSNPFGQRRKEKVVKLRGPSHWGRLKTHMERCNVTCLNLDHPTVIFFYSGSVAALPKATEKVRGKRANNVWIVDEVGAVQLGAKL